MGHPWIYDDEVSNIADLNGIDAGTLVDILRCDGEELGVGVLNRQASIVLRRMEDLSPGMEVTQDLLQVRLRRAFAAREARKGHRAAFCRAVHGEQDGLPGVIVDRFGKSAVVIFESVGSAKLELVVQEELTRWIGKLHQLTVHRMTSKKEKWAQEGSEFTTSITRGDSSKVRVEEDNGVCFDIDVLQGLLVGHWNYGLEDMRREVVERFGAGTVLDAWAQSGQWGIRCAKAGAEEVVLLEDTLGLAKLCRENAILNGVQEQCTVLHRGDVAGELRNMATSGIRFNCVSLNIRVRFERYFKHQRGQFGKWYKPSLKGYERAISLGATVTSRNGYLVVTFLLPLTTEYWALNLVQGALERASRVGSIIYFSTAITEDSAMPSATMDEFWSHVLICVKMSWSDGDDKSLPKINQSCSRRSFIRKRLVSLNRRFRSDLQSTALDMQLFASAESRSIPWVVMLLLVASAGVTSAVATLWAQVSRSQSLEELQEQLQRFCFVVSGCSLTWPQLQAGELQRLFTVSLLRAGDQSARLLTDVSIFVCCGTLLERLYGSTFLLQLILSSTVLSNVFALCIHQHFTAPSGDCAGRISSSSAAVVTLGTFCALQHGRWAAWRGVPVPIAWLMAPILVADLSLAQSYIHDLALHRAEARAAQETQKADHPDSSGIPRPIALAACLAVEDAARAHFYPPAEDIVSWRIDLESAMEEDPPPSPE
ncbi:rlmI, partial [Symbiodinium pilosum]